MSAEALQTWLQTFIVAPGDDALHQANQSAGWGDRVAEELVLPSATMSSLERLEVYRDQYLLRMEEALATDFPRVKARLGDKRFRQLVASYVQKHPSTSYTLNHLGRCFADFLSPPLSELARLEWTLCELYDLESSPGVPIDRLAELSLDEWAVATMRPVEAFRWLELTHAVQRTPMRKTPTTVICWCNDERLHHEVLTKPQADLLRTLLDGAALNPAMGAVLSRHRVAPRKLFDALTVWIAQGLFKEISC